MADVIEVNCETGEVTTRSLTVDEIAERETNRVQAEADQVVKDAEAKKLADDKASAVAKLSAIGLSDAEIAALIG